MPDELTTTETTSDEITKSGTIESYNIRFTITLSRRTFSFILDSNGRAELRKQLRAAGVNIPALKKATKPYQIVDTKIELEGRSITIEVDQDIPEGQDATAYNLLFLWVLQEPKEPRKRTVAKQDGAILTSGARVLTITDKDYQFALTTRRNNTAYIQPLPKDSIDSLHFFDTGELAVDGATISLKDIRQKTDRGLVSLELDDIQTLRQFATAAFKHVRSATKDTIDVYYPSFFREIGIDVQSHTGPKKKDAQDGDAAESADPIQDGDEKKARSKAVNFQEKLKTFESCIGIINGGRSRWKVFDVIGIDLDKQTVTISMPYILRVYEMIQGKYQVEKPKKGPPQLPPAWYSPLIHSRIAGERNKPAIEIVNLLITRLARRGGRPIAKIRPNSKFIDQDIVPYHITFRSIVNDIPMLHDRLENTKSTSNKNQVLKRAFSGAYKLMHTRTDAYQYYIDLQIPEIIPTVSTLDTQLVITHKGINGDFHLHGEVY